MRTGCKHHEVREASAAVPHWAAAALEGWQPASAWQTDNHSTPVSDAKSALVMQLLQVPGTTLTVPPWQCRTAMGHGMACGLCKSLLHACQSLYSTVLAAIRKTPPKHNDLEASSDSGHGDRQ